MQLPALVSSYFEGDQAGDARRVLAVFASDATVRDEGRTYEGTEAIGAWWRATKDKYRHSARPLLVEESGRKTIVKAEVSGRFPGSPAVLSFAFDLADDRVARLEIGA